MLEKEDSSQLLAARQQFEEIAKTKTAGSDVLDTIGSLDLVNLVGLVGSAQLNGSLRVIFRESGGWQTQSAPSQQ